MLHIYYYDYVLAYMMVPDFRTFVVLLRKSSSQQRPVTVYYVCVYAEFIANILQRFKEIMGIFFFFFFFNEQNHSEWFQMTWSYKNTLWSLPAALQCDRCWF